MSKREYEPAQKRMPILQRQTRDSGAVLGRRSVWFWPYGGYCVVLYTSVVLDCRYLESKCGLRQCIQVPSWKGMDRGDFVMFPLAEAKLYFSRTIFPVCFLLERPTRLEILMEIRRLEMRQQPILAQSAVISLPPQPLRSQACHGFTFSWILLERLCLLGQVSVLSSVMTGVSVPGTVLMDSSSPDPECSFPFSTLPSLPDW